MGNADIKVHKWEEAGIVRCPEGNPSRQEAQGNVRKHQKNLEINTGWCLPIEGLECQAEELEFSSLSSREPQGVWEQESDDE